MSEQFKKSALVQGYLDAMAPAVPPTEYENMPFETPHDAPLWISLSFLPVSSRAATIGVGGEDEDIGLLQIDINVPTGRSEKDLIQTADKLRSYFTAGRHLVYNGFTVVVRSRVLSPSRKVDVWHRRSLTVTFYSRSNR
jgi:hypothetical protein